MSSRRLGRREAMTGVLMAAPSVLGVLAFGLIPFLYVIYYSLHDWTPLSGEFTWIGLENYRRMFGDPQVWSALWVTLRFALILVVANIILSMSLALLLNRQFPGRASFRAAFFTPVVVSTVAWVLVWNYLVAANGGINGFLEMIGIEGPVWLRDEKWALFTVAMIQVFKGAGFNMILILAALQKVPKDLIDAARMDGAAPSQIFRRITIPMISPTILMVSIITLIGAMDVFIPIQVLTSGGPGDSTTVISYLLYRTAFRQQEFGYASAIGVLLFVVVLAMTIVQWQSRKRWVHDEI